MNNSPYPQMLIVLIFGLLNFGLLTNAVEVKPYPDGPLISPTFIAAADGQRYWGVAISLAEKRQFNIPPLWDSRPELPLQRSGPIPAIAFSIPIRILGFDNSSVAIVCLQCFLLYIISLLSRNLATQFNATPTLVQCLVLFNPNLIGLAHYAQSDLIFTFFVTLVVVTASQIIRNPLNKFVSKSFLVSVFAGLACLTRDVGFIFSIALPIIFFLVFLCHNKRNLISLKTYFFALTIAVFSFLIVVSPWSIRNYIVSGQASPIIGESEQLRYMYRQLLLAESTLPYSIVDSEIEDDINKYINNYLVQIGASHCDYASTSSSSCKKHIQAAYISAIFSRPLLNILRLFVASGTKTMIAGGTTRVANYLGIYADEEQQLSNDLSYKTLESRFLSVKNTERIPYVLIFFISTGFAILGRIFGVWGLITAIKYKALIPFHLYYLLVTLSFLIVYSVISTSRFRAPLEPILMLYASVGITNIRNQIKAKFYN